MLIYLADGVLIHLHKTSSLFCQVLTNSTSFMNVLPHCLIYHFSYLHPMSVTLFFLSQIYLFLPVGSMNSNMPPSNYKQRPTLQDPYKTSVLMFAHTLSSVQPQLVLIFQYLYPTFATILYFYHILFHMLQSRITSLPCIYFTNCTTSKQTFPRTSGSPTPFVGLSASLVTLNQASFQLLQVFSIAFTEQLIFLDLWNTSSGLPVCLLFSPFFRNPICFLLLPRILILNVT